MPGSVFRTRAISFLRSRPAGCKWARPPFPGASPAGTDRVSPRPHPPQVFPPLVALRVRCRTPKRRPYQTESDRTPEGAGAPTLDEVDALGRPARPASSDAGAGLLFDRVAKR